MWMVLVAIALFERIVFDLGPNIELVTTVTVIAGIYLSKRDSMLVPMAVMMLSDVYLGFGMISFFTWSGFAVIGPTTRFLKGRYSSNYVVAGGGAVIGNTVFYLWTNFGVWLTDGWGMYPDTLGGLMQSMVMGIPFYKMQLFSSAIFIPLAIFTCNYLKSARVKYAGKFSNKNRSYIGK